jgi:hypothetical protein
MDPTRYIMEVPKNYKPYIYLPKRLLQDFLREKHIINLSNYQPSPEEIEILALDLNFITDQVTPQKDSEIDLSKFINKLNTQIHFSNSTSQTRKGYINRLFNEPWEAPHQSWQTDKNVSYCLDQLRDALTSQTNNNNLPEPLAKALKNLQQNLGFYICKADKGGATVLWPRDQYHREALRQLNDQETYEEIPASLKSATINSLTKLKDELAEWLHHLKLITKREKETIIDTETKFPCIYFLPKIHKKENETSKTFPGRPIVATFNCALHWIDKYLTEVTNPIHKEIPNTLLDTTDLINKLPTDRTSTDQKLLSADVDALYPSIDWEGGIRAATEIFTMNRPKLASEALANNKLPPPTPYVFKTLLKAILENSYIEFQGHSIFHQIKGTAMGMCISVFLARSYMYFTCLPLLQNPPEHLEMFEVYIDDIFIITTGTKEQINEMFSTISNEHISYTHSEPDTCCEMLDLTIHITEDGFITKPFTKPTSSPFYLHAKSMHSKATIQSIPYSQFLRLRRNATYTKDFLEPAKKLMRTLKLRGYPTKALKTSYDKALLLPRMDLLIKHPQKRSFASKTKLILQFNNGTNWSKVSSCLTRFHKAVTNHYSGQDTLITLAKIQPAIVYKNMKSIGATFSPSYKIGDQQ